MNLIRRWACRPFVSQACFTRVDAVYCRDDPQDNTCSYISSHRALWQWKYAKFQLTVTKDGFGRTRCHREIVEYVLPTKNRKLIARIGDWLFHERTACCIPTMQYSDNAKEVDCFLLLHGRRMDCVLPKRRRHNADFYIYTISFRNLLTPHSRIGDSTWSYLATDTITLAAMYLNDTLGLTATSVGMDEVQRQPNGIVTLEHCSEQKCDQA